MDTRSADYLRHRLLRFATAIEETRDHSFELSPFGRYPASAPWYERAGILEFLHSSGPGACTREEFLLEFQRNEAQLRSLAEELGAPYRRQLREELTAYVDRYHAAVCMEAIAMTAFGTDHELFCRDRIAVLMMELEKDHDLRELKRLVNALDQGLFPASTGQDGGAGSDRRYTEECIPSRRKKDKIQS